MILSYQKMALFLLNDKNMLKNGLGLLFFAYYTLFIIYERTFIIDYFL